MASKNSKGINQKSGRPDRRWQDEKLGSDKQWIRKQKQRHEDRDYREQLDDYGFPIDE